MKLKTLILLISIQLINGLLFTDNDVSLFRKHFHSVSVISVYYIDEPLNLRQTNDNIYWINEFLQLLVTSN